LAIDRVKPLKLESPDSGGVETDEFPTSLDPSEDYVDCHGVALQSVDSNDEKVLVDRDHLGNMTFRDEHVSPISLIALTAGGFDINNYIFDNAGGFVYDNDEIFVKRM